MFHLEQPSCREQHQCILARGRSLESGRLQTTKSKQSSRKKKKKEKQTLAPPHGSWKNEAYVVTDEATVSVGQRIQLIVTVAKDGTGGQSPWRLVSQPSILGNWNQTDLESWKL